MSAIVARKKSGLHCAKPGKNHDACLASGYKSYPQKYCILQRNIARRMHSRTDKVAPLIRLTATLSLVFRPRDFYECSLTYMNQPKSFVYFWQNTLNFTIQPGWALPIDDIMTRQSDRHAHCSGKKNLFDCYDWKNLTSVTFVYAQLFMTVQVRKVASISVLCSLLFFFCTEGGGFPKTEVHFAYMRQKKTNKKQEKKSRCFFKEFLWPIYLVSSLVFIVPYPDQLDTVIASGHRRLRQPCTCIWNIRCNGVNDN